MTKQRLNYSAHAIEDLKKQIAMLERMGWNRDAQAMKQIIVDMRAAQKFILPHSGDLIFDEGDMPEGIELQRLPYPVTLIEFPYGSDGVSDMEVRSTRRLAVAIECHIDEKLQVHEEGEKNGYVLKAASYMDDNRMWTVMAGAVVMLYGEQSVKNEAEHVLPVHRSRSAMPMGLFPLLPDQVGKLREAYPGQVKESMAHDIGREANIMVEFLSVMSCSNVGTEIDRPSSVLNKARKRSKKEPFFDYHILTVGNARNGGDGRGAQSNGSDEGNRVRTHLRRGHIRRLDDARRIWVNATIVAPDSTKGVAAKDYRVTARR